MKDSISPKKIIEHIYSKNKWELEKPQLILSVTGGYKRFSIPNRMKRAFKKGLVKAAQSTNSIIITNGSHSGVAKLVGEAVSENAHHKLNVIGIVSWGTVAYREKLEVRIFNEIKLLTR